MRRIFALSQLLAVVLGCLGIAGLYLSGFEAYQPNLKLWPVMLVVEAFGCSLVGLYAAIRLARGAPSE